MEDTNNQNQTNHPSNRGNGTGDAGNHTGTANRPTRSSSHRGGRKHYNHNSGKRPQETAGTEAAASSRQDNRKPNSAEKSPRDSRQEQPGKGDRNRRNNQSQTREQNDRGGNRPNHADRNNRNSRGGQSDRNPNGSGNRAGRGNIHAEGQNNRPVRENRSPEATETKGRENGFRQNPAARSGIKPPARTDRSAQVFPFPYEADQDPAAEFRPVEKPEPVEELPVLTAENYLEDSACFAKAPNVSATVSEPGEERVEIVGVRFRGAGKVYSFAPGKLRLHPGDFVIVDTARGEEFGEVMTPCRFVPEKEIILPLRPVFRIATEEDVRHNQDNRQREEEAMGICKQKIAAHGLEMKLIEAQYTFDNSKLLFYFTSDGRVDFRELVKDLAGVFRTRIELRQIGIRDEARLLGGLGVCGKSLCCSSYLSDFVQVSIKMAKEQNLSLNSSKISGCCGRLMCCLRYEYDVYQEEIKQTPPVDSMVRTADGIGRVTSINPLAGIVRVHLMVTPDVPQKEYHRDDVVVLPKDGYPASRRQNQEARHEDRNSEESDSNTQNVNPPVQETPPAVENAENQDLQN